MPFYDAQPFFYQFDSLDQAFFRVTFLITANIFQHTAKDADSFAKDTNPFLYFPYHIAV